MRMRRMGMRSMNPVFRNARQHEGVASEHTATYAGVISKSALLLGLMVFFGGLSMSRLIGQAELPPGGVGMLIAAPIIALICVIVASTSLRLAPTFTIVYAIAQGTFLGVISGFYEIVFGDHIVVTALLATVAVFASMLTLYATGLVRVGNMMRKVLFTALLGLLFTSLLLMMLSLFGAFSYQENLGLIFIICIVAIIVATLFLLVDFDNIQRAVEGGADKRAEWVLSLGLLVTLVWLYIELLRFIAIVRQRR